MRVRLGLATAFGIVLLAAWQSNTSLSPVGAGVPMATWLALAAAIGLIALGLEWAVRALDAWGARLDQIIRVARGGRVLEFRVPGLRH